MPRKTMCNNELLDSLLKPIPIPDDLPTALNRRSLRAVENENRDNRKRHEQCEFEEKGSKFGFRPRASVVDMEDGLHCEKP